jgi:hypothetical protein
MAAFLDPFLRRLFDSAHRQRKICFAAINSAGGKNCLVAATGGSVSARLDAKNFPG